MAAMSLLIHYRRDSGASALAKRVLQPIMLALTLTLEVKFNKDYRVQTRLMGH